MLKLNKYLREIGYSEEVFPFKKENNQYNENEDGFVPAEFYNLDCTFDLFIYSHLCYFRENYADICTPGCFIEGYTDKDNKGHKKWLRMLDKMIFGFKVACCPEENMQQELLKTNKEGLELFYEVEKYHKKSKTLLMKYWGILGW